MAEIDGKLYVLNSSKSIYECTKTFEVFDPKLNQWTALSDPPFITGIHPVRPGFAEFCYLTLTSFKEIFLSSPAFGVLRYDIDDDIWYSDMTFGPPLLPFMDKSGVSFNFGDEDVCIGFENGFLTAYLVKEIWGFKKVTKVQKLGLIASEDNGCCCFAKLGGQKMCLVTNTEDSDLDEIDVVVATCEFERLKDIAASQGKPVVDDTNGCDFTLEEREAILRYDFWRGILWIFVSSVNIVTPAIDLLLGLAFFGKQLGASSLANKEDGANFCLSVL
ncbi:PREDICTED: uncharacterized protein LOC18595100 [Theobroma cacao]|uniref:Uncharacterized protein LOC18595100 n=1 Tax=Theobroma cacao TaxID=3641 RepID=A0AB32WND0_THECC|nr:PREDICTED: uncharacterized protein LOC18595100 [Theobroma cacao]